MKSGLRQDLPPGGWKENRFRQHQSEGGTRQETGGSRHGTEGHPEKLPPQVPVTHKCKSLEESKSFSCSAQKHIVLPRGRKSNSFLFTFFFLLQSRVNGGKYKKSCCALLEENESILFGECIIIFLLCENKVFLKKNTVTFKVILS